MAEQTLQNMEVLLLAGFNKIDDWQLADGKIRFTGQIPSEPGVYAHILDGKIYYIGSATMGLKKRLYFYAKPGITKHDVLLKELGDLQIDWKRGKSIIRLAARKTVLMPWRAWSSS